MRAGTGWTPDEIAVLREMAADKGLTAADISIALTDRFGRIISRSAVLGQAHRHKVQIGTPRAKPGEKKVTAAQARVHRLSVVARRQRPKPPSSKVMAPPPPGHRPGDPWPDDKVHWPGTSEPPHGRQCAWPIGEPDAPGFGFCGRTVSANPDLPFPRTYCRAHGRRAMRQKKPAEAEA